MTANICKLDRVIRIILGVALIMATILGYIGAWGWIGLVPLLTGIIRFCPLYTMIGFSSCPKK